MIKQALGRIKTASKTAIRAELDCLDLLRSDHMKVEAMLVQLRVIRNPEHRMQVFKKVRSELEKHMRIEEAIFYPACTSVDKLKGLVEHSYEEHADVKKMLRDLQSIVSSPKPFSKKLTQMVMDIETHVSKEEEQLFPMVRKEMSDIEFKRLSREILEAHQGGPRVQRARKAA